MMAFNQEQVYFAANDLACSIVDKLYAKSSELRHSQMMTRSILLKLLWYSYLKESPL